MGALLTDEQIRAAMLAAFPLTKCSPAYIKFARNIERAAREAARAGQQNTSIEDSAERCSESAQRAVVESVSVTINKSGLERYFADGPSGHFYARSMEDAERWIATDALAHGHDATDDYTVTDLLNARRVAG